ncbi:MAG: hypothetical protein HY293_09415 [Planctomycetes bacterium]|nr:hypothetical protein [Planctomycetota bacterium]
MCALILPTCGDSSNVVSSGSGFVLTASTASFSAVQGAGNPPSQGLSLIGPIRYRLGSGGWTASSDQAWLTVSPSSGTMGTGQAVPLTLSVQVPAAQAESWIGATSTLNSPSPREDHDAAWTGSRMVVWGGEISDGFLYSPASDQWLGTISTTTAPSPRSLHSAVWTGTRMIVWGGYDGATLVNTGGIYDPATDQWVGSTTTVNAPTPRLHHVAVWTGTAMIVWGGQDATGNVNDGKRYDPVLDQWTPLNPAGAPTARQAAAAVWTGNEMLLWGGNDGSGALNTGGRYDPVLDSWVGAITTVGAPTARQSLSAVWTGSRMLVSHGASPTAGFFDTGGIYQPAISGLGTFTATVTVQPAGAPPLTLLVTLTVTP